MKHNTKLFLKTALFSVVAPGMVAVFLPLLIVRGRAAASGVTLGAALLLLALGAAIFLRCAWDFVVAGKGTPAPIDQPKRLVIRGLYRYSRNPMYVGVLSVIAGWAVLFGAGILAAYAAAWFVIFSLFVRFYEEPHLTRKFGDEYAAYRERVGRWLPRRSRGNVR
ncbi:methyltransferase family protein [Candidatus Palauibacter sp.]|uniref:methyltransferase family protein n=1 Tax=Candidatus Palauibacter sp. TaxID=3101350 RepID=UPI003AF259C1